MESGVTSSSGEEVQVSEVMDVAGLMLSDTDAIPVRLKLLLDRLLSSMSRDQTMRVLHACDWTYDDFCRGYKLQVTPTQWSLHIGL